MSLDHMALLRPSLGFPSGLGEQGLPHTVCEVVRLWGRGLACSLLLTDLSACMLPAVPGTPRGWALGLCPAAAARGPTPLLSRLREPESHCCALCPHGVLTARCVVWACFHSWAVSPTGVGLWQGHCCVPCIPQCRPRMEQNYLCCVQTGRHTCPVSFPCSPRGVEPGGHPFDEPGTQPCMSVGGSSDAGPHPL